jgi:hypothetical protein
MMQGCLISLRQIMIVHRATRHYEDQQFDRLASMLHHAICADLTNK